MWAPIYRTDILSVVRAGPVYGKAGGVVETTPGAGTSDLSVYWTERSLQPSRMHPIRPAVVTA